jgi:ATP adenylyltransferase
MQQMWTPWRMSYIRREKRPGCIFCEMLEAEDDRGQLILHRSGLSFLVLNKYPYNNGHLMAVPYRHVDTLEALTTEESADMMAEVALGIRALRKSANPEGFNIGVNIGKIAGAGVIDHVHAHVVPRWGGDTNFMPVLADVRLIPQDLNETYDELKVAVDELLRARGG